MQESHIAITISHITVAYDQSPVLWDVSANILKGDFLAIVGPNGAGKSTLLKTLVNLIEPITGQIHFFGKSFNTQRARIAYVPQRTSLDWQFPITVLDMVLMGMYPAIGWFSRPKENEYRYAHELLARVDMAEYAHRSISELSGGQQQRICIARALAQRAEIYLLDEPFAGIDNATERLLVSIFKSMQVDGKTIVVVHHDLQTLNEYFDSILLLNKRCIAFGPVQKICRPEYICAAYGNNAMVKPFTFER